MSFWTDSKVVDDFTPEDRYFYLYLMTNPHTNLSGCYELSLKQASDETGYTKEVIRNLLDRFENIHNVIRYSYTTKEVLILNWHKFNWTKSKDFQKPLIKEIEAVKEVDFQRFLEDALEGVKTVPRPSLDGVGTTVTVTDTVSVPDTVTVTDIVPKKSVLKEEFETLWSLYPRKQGKDKAFGYYEKARKSGTTYEEVENGIYAYIRYIQAEQTEQQYVKMGSTFFSQKAWQDDWTVVLKPKSSGNPFDDLHRKMTGKGVFDDFR